MVLHKRVCLFYLVLAVFSIFLACLPINYDYDLFARLIVGERYIEHGILPFKDFLSYTPTHPWYDHEWGSGVVFYLLLKHLGPLGLVFFQALVTFLISVFVVKTQQLQKHSFPPSILFMAIFMIAFTHLNSALVRCQLFSFLFFSIFLYILEKTRKGLYENKFNPLWLFPIIIIFWNNVHGGVVSGLGLIGMYFVGALLEKKPWKQYLTVLILSFLSLIINPYGLKYLNFLFSAATMNRKYVVEWWPFFAKRHFAYYLFPSLYGITGFLASIRKSKFDITKLIVLISTLYLGLAHVKLLSITMIATASLCYNDFVLLFIKLKNILKKLEKCLYPAIVVLALLIPMFSPNAGRADFTKFPLLEIEFLKINNIKGNLVTPFGLGSYATFKLYPNNLIFMDGRYEEVYNDREFLVLREYELVGETWDDIVKSYATTILMPIKDSLIYNHLLKTKDWVKIYDGNLCGIFIKANKKNNIYKEPDKNINYYKETMFNHGDFIND